MAEKVTRPRTRAATKFVWSQKLCAWNVKPKGNWTRMIYTLCWSNDMDFTSLETCICLWQPENVLGRNVRDRWCHVNADMQTNSLQLKIPFFDKFLNGVAEAYTTGGCFLSIRRFLWNCWHKNGDNRKLTSTPVTSYILISIFYHRMNPGKVIITFPSLLLQKHQLLIRAWSIKKRRTIGKASQTEDVVNNRTPTFNCWRSTIFMFALTFLLDESFLLQMYLWVFCCFVVVILRPTHASTLPHTAKFVSVSQPN